MLSVRGKEVTIPAKDNTSIKMYGESVCWLNKKQKNKAKKYLDAWLTIYKKQAVFDNPGYKISTDMPEELVIRNPYNELPGFIGYKFFIERPKDAEIKPNKVLRAGASLEEVQEFFSKEWGSENDLD